MIYNSLDISSSQSISKKELRVLNSFLIGFITYTISFTLSYIPSPSATNILHVIQIISLILIIGTSIFLIQFKIKNQYLKIVYILYCLWLLIIIIRGFQIDGTFIKNMIYDARYGILPYFVPLILLVPTTPSFFKKLFHVILILGAFFIVIDLLFIRELLNNDRANETSQTMIEIFASTLSLPSGFLLLTFSYHSNKKNLFALFVIVLTFLFAIIRARRGLIFMCSATLLFFYLLFIFSSKKKIIIIYLSIFLVLIGLIYKSNIYKIGNNNIFNFVLDRGNEDTRTGVELYFYNDLKTKDWIIGKGINGQYFCPAIDNDEVSNYRSVIETDYLQIILNGGLISLILLLLVLIPAIILGLFFSKNNFTKGVAIWILLWITFLYPARVSTFTLHYLLVWISVGICYSKRFRNMSENSIKHFFQTEELLYTSNLK